jgi:hypothetical protein
MSVCLVFQQWVTHPHQHYLLHPTYMAFMKHVNCGDAWCGNVLSKNGQHDLLNLHLAMFGGKVAEFNNDQIVFEFESACDLTRFVLSWS